MDEFDFKDVGYCKYGMTLQLGNREIYVKRVVEKSGIINILKLRNVAIRH